MPDPALVFSDGRPDDVPGVHAIVIGIGHYRHFPNGEGIEFDTRGESMRQLSSPPHSARAVADWLLLTYHDDQDRPLRSLSMVIADRDGPAEYAHLLVPARDVPDGKIEDIRSAVQQWFERGDKNDENLLIFYICCHGIATEGDQQTLLASDFLADQFDLFRHAIDFTHFYAGMARCAAKHQVYFIDACREISDNLLTDGSKGTPIVSRDSQHFQKTAPVFFSALVGEEAKAFPNEPSPFAQALPRAFKGGAWERQAGKWHVVAGRLQRAIEHQVRRVMGGLRSHASLVEADGVVTMTLKVIEDGAKPLVPFELTCDPASANKLVQLSLQRGNGAAQLIPLRNPASEESWLLDLPEGTYEFQAKFPAADSGFGNARLIGIVVAPPDGSEPIIVA